MSLKNAPVSQWMVPIQKSGITRRDLLKASGVGLAVVAGSRLLSYADTPQTLHTVKDNSAAVPSGDVPRPNHPQYVLGIQHTKLNPDGAKVMPAITANGVFPAPEIRVKEGDLLRLQVENRLGNQAASLHWHGLLLPAGMDGVPEISQAPIAPGRVFVYEYPILQSGTYWYHSHFQLQEQIGLGGPFIIEAKHEPLQYDHDYVLFLSDWLHSDPYRVIPDLIKKGADAGDDSPDLADVQYDALLLNGKGNADPWTCMARTGERVRFRIINGSASTFFRFMIDGHDLQVTHADGLAVRPVLVDNLTIGTAECYDVLVTVAKSGSYTIRAEGLGESGMQALGVLHSPDVRPKTNPARPFWASRELSYRQLSAPEPTTLPQGPVKELTLNLTGDMSKYVWSINDQVYPKADPLMIEQGDRVRIKMINKTMMWHPMHLHGHFFRLLQAGVDERFAPLKHTVRVGAKETVNIEFTADNPGNWFFHCHNLYHLDAGMAREFIYKV